MNAEIISRQWLLVSELYPHPTVQGEGPSIGRRCTFLRLGGCNLRCGINGGWRCDTPYTWDFQGVLGHRYDPQVELTRVTMQDVVSWLRGHVAQGVDLLVITGGEPLLQQAGLCELIRVSRFEFPDLEFEIETNGTIRPLTALLSSSRVSFNVSPKLSNSGNPRDQRINLVALRDFVKAKAIYKFVVSSPDDLDEIDDLVTQAEIPRRRVYLMPEGTDSETVSRHLTALADLAIKRGYNLTTRLHIILWGKERLR